MQVWFQNRRAKDKRMQKGDESGSPTADMPEKSLRTAGDAMRSDNSIYVPDDSSQEDLEMETGSNQQVQAQGTWPLRTL